MGLLIARPGPRFFSLYCRKDSEMLSRRWSHFLLWIACSALILFGIAFNRRAIAQENESPFLFGHDFELSTQQLANIVPHLDLQRMETRLRIRNEVWQQVMSREILDEYISYPGALEDLPPEVREKLTKDLNLNLNLVDHRSSDLVAPSIILSANPQAPGPNSKLEPKPLNLGPSGIAVTPSAGLPTRRALETNRSGLLVPKGSDWQELARRWRELSQDERLKIARFQRLPSRVVADIIETKIPIQSKSVAELDLYLRPKDGAPEWMSRVTYSLDGRNRGANPGARQSLEIALKSPTSNKDEFFRHLDEVAKTTGLKTQLDSPQLMKRSSAATHIHFSVKAVDEKAMERVMHAWRRLVMVRLLDAGEQYDPILEIPVGDRGYMLQNIYDHKLSAKHSLVRKVEGNHYELKEHAKNVKDELSEVLALVMTDEKSAIEKMSREVAQTTARNPSILERIKRINPYILRDFRDVVPQAEIDLKIDEVTRRAVSSDNWKVVYGHLSRFSDKSYATDEVWTMFERLLKDPPGPLVDYGVSTIVRGWYLGHDHPISKKFLNHYLLHPEQLNEDVLHTLRVTGVLKPSFEQEFATKLASAVEKSEVVGIGRRAASALREMAFAYRLKDGIDRKTKSVVYNAIDQVLKSRSKLDDNDLVSLHAAAFRVNSEHKVPDSDRPLFRRMILSPNEETVRDSLYVVERAMPSEMMFANIADSTYNNFYRDQALASAKKIAKSRPSEIIRHVTDFESHGASSLNGFADLHSVPGFTDEVVRRIQNPGKKSVFSALGRYGFPPLFRVHSVAAFNALADAVEASDQPELKKQFKDVAPESLEKALKLSGEWTPSIESEVQARITRIIPPETLVETHSPSAQVPDRPVATKEAFGERCTILWAKLKRLGL